MSSSKRILMNIKRILCPTDLSAGSDEALYYAMALARRYNAKLIAFHGDPTNGDAEVLLSEVKAFFERSLFQHLGPAELAAIEWERVVEQCDDPGAAITRYAAEHTIDLIVMRSRRRPHRAALLGSTAESVSRTAPCPVLVMHSDERDWVSGSNTRIELKRVLVAYDFSDYSELALNYALSFAQEHQSELHLLHVLPSFAVNNPVHTWYPPRNEGPYHQGRRRLQNAMSAAAHPSVAITYAISEGQPYREILDYAEKNDIDLICLGAHGAGFGLRSMFGSNVDRVLRQAPCPVLVTRPLKPAMTFRQEPNAEFAVAAL